MVEARFSNGKTSDTSVVELKLDGDNLIFTGADGNWRWSLKDCLIEAPFKGAPIKIEYYEGGLLIIDSYDDTFLKKVLSKKSQFLHLLENKKSFFFGAVIILGLFFSFVFGVVIPKGAHFISQKIPYKYGVKLDTHLVEKLSEQGFEKSDLDEELQSEVREYLRVQAPEKYRDVVINFRKTRSPIPNAFALSTNQVILTDQIVLSLKREELLLVYYHELGHLEERHLMGNILRGITLGIFSYMIIGDLTGGTESLATIGLTLLGLSYDREFERQADEFSLKIARMKNAQPSCFVSAFEKIEGSIGKLLGEDEDDEKKEDSFFHRLMTFEYLSTHPSSENRVKQFHTADKCQATDWDGLKAPPLLELNPEYSLPQQ